MARALFFIEALVLVAVAALFPLFAADLSSAVLAPLGVAILVPVLAAVSVRPLRDLKDAFAYAFLGTRRPGMAARAARILEEFSGFAMVGGLLGLLASLVAALSMMGKAVRLSHWVLLGSFWLFYGFLETMVAAVLRAVVERLGRPPANADVEGAAAAAFVERYGLTPREWEVAARIAGGQSYKEAADGLFISIKTVKSHIASVYRKTSTGDKLSLVLLLREESGAGDRE